MKKLLALFLLAVSAAFAQAAPDTIATANVGQTVTLTVSVTAGSNLAYQWAKDGVAMPNQTGYQLVLAKITAAQAGAYTAKVSNAQGSTLSNNAVITVVVPLPAPAGAVITAVVTP